MRLNRTISVALLSSCSFFAFVDVYLVVVTFRDIAGREAVATNTERFDDGINRPQKEQCECNQYGNRWPSERHVRQGTHRKTFEFPPVEAVSCFPAARSGPPAVRWTFRPQMGRSVLLMTGFLGFIGKLGPFTTASFAPTSVNLWDATRFDHRFGEENFSPIA